MNQTPDSRAAQSSMGPSPDANALWQEAKNVVSQVADQATEKIKSEVDSKREKAAEKVGEVASALRDTSEKLKDVGPIPDLADQAAAQIEKIATYVQTRNVGDLVREVERFARREPAIFLGASFVVGLLGGRFMKASSNRPVDAFAAERALLERHSKGGQMTGRQTDLWTPGPPAAEASESTGTAEPKMPAPMRTAVDEAQARVPRPGDTTSAANMHPVAKADRPSPSPDKAGGPDASKHSNATR